MPEYDELTLEQVDARLELLEHQEEQLDDLHERWQCATDDLGAITDHDLVDADLTAKVDLLKTMLDWVLHHDLTHDRRIHYERDRLRRRKWELEREQEVNDV